MKTDRRIRRAGVIAVIVLGAALAGSPAQAIPTSWSGPDVGPLAHCTYGHATGAAAPDWCSGTGADQD